MPSSTSSASFTQNSFTLLLFFVLLIAFFPGAFHYLSTLPFSLFYPRSHTPPDPCAPPATTPPVSDMSWAQKQFTLPPRSRGSYLVTDHVVSSVPEIRQYKVGLLHLFVQHTSCALSLNENWDDDVRADMSDALDRIAPEAGPKGEELYRHSAEGSDDMPAHIKSALIGASVTIPIKDGKLATGTWQGIWYLEFRQVKHTRRVVATIQGEKA
ncbi:UPF0047-domain-containing protein [Hypoxylon sp. FL1150]|nr:UPF0047-domain-containing protein [Hypoxylon sp. FL1150]